MSYGGSKSNVLQNILCIILQFADFVAKGLNLNGWPQVLIVELTWVECTHQAMVLNMCLVVLMYDCYLTRLMIYCLFATALRIYYLGVIL